MLFYGVCLAQLAAPRWIDPPTTSVQGQRRVQAWLRGAGPDDRPTASFSAALEGGLPAFAGRRVLARLRTLRW